MENLYQWVGRSMDLIQVKHLLYQPVVLVVEELVAAEVVVEVVDQEVAVLQVQALLLVMPVVL